MKKLAIALAGMTLGLAACNSGSEDTVDNAAVDVPTSDELNQSALDAANDMNADAEALGDQLNELQNEAPTEEARSPSDAQEQNVAGM